MDRREEIEKIREEVLNNGGILNYSEWQQVCVKDQVSRKIISSIQKVCKEVRSCLVDQSRIESKFDGLRPKLELVDQQIKAVEKKIDAIIESLVEIREDSIKAKKHILEIEDLWL